MLAPCTAARCEWSVHSRHLGPCNGDDFNENRWQPRADGRCQMASRCSRWHVHPFREPAQRNAKRKVWIGTLDTGCIARGLNFMKLCLWFPTLVTSSCIPLLNFAESSRINRFCQRLLRFAPRHGRRRLFSGQVMKFSIDTNRNGSRVKKQCRKRMPKRWRSRANDLPFCWSCKWLHRKFWDTWVWRVKGLRFCSSVCPVFTVGPVDLLCLVSQVERPCEEQQLPDVTCTSGNPPAFWLHVCTVGAFWLQPSGSVFVIQVLAACHANGSGLKDRLQMWKMNENDMKMIHRRYDMNNSWVFTSFCWKLPPCR